MNILYFVLLGVGSYIFGNISNARMIGKFIKKDDITKRGSGNPGTMNVLRNYGVKIAILTLFLDMLKGLLPALTGFLLFGYNGLYIAGACAVVGHVFPVFYKFKGGKGIATSLGVFAMAAPLWTLLVFVLLIGFIFTFEYGGVASMLAIAILTCIEVVHFPGNYIVVSCLVIIFLLTWVMHQKNIVKMLSGKENKTRLRHMLLKKDKDE